MLNKEAYSRALGSIEATIDSIGNLKSLSESFWGRLFSIFEGSSGKVILTGVGKSGYIAMKVAATFTSLGRQAIFIHPVEAMHGDSGNICDGDVIIAFSFSGNTGELVRFISYVKENFDVRVIVVTGGIKSALAELADVVAPLTVEREGCPLDLAPMASTTAMLAMGDAIAAGLTAPESFSRRDFARFHPSGTLGLSLTQVREKARFGEDISIHAQVPLQEALQRISSIGKGIIAVTGGDGELLGSITDGDVRRYFSCNSSSEGVFAADIMCKEPKSISATQTLKEALDAMDAHKITNLFVVDENERLVGVIHIHDIVGV